MRISWSVQGVTKFMAGLEEAWLFFVVYCEGPYQFCRVFIAVFLVVEG